MGRGTCGSVVHKVWPSVTCSGGRPTILIFLFVAEKKILLGSNNKKYTARPGLNKFRSAWSLTTKEELFIDF